MRTRLLLVFTALIASVTVSSAWAAVGRTVGQFQVSPTGSAQYSIPIFAPPGPHGVQPHIALSYDSQRGNGYVGVGWGVSGLSSIYRCNKTIAQDGDSAPIALATSDGYCMDGNRLRLTGGTYGAASSTYQTEIANFVTVEAYGSAGNGPAYWLAKDRNGWQYSYGQGGTTSNAQVLASGSTTAISWQLNEVKDPNGNSMTITYLTSSAVGLVVPHVISWVPASAGSSSYNDTMTFSYSTTDTGSVHGYVSGKPFSDTNILSSIAIAYQGTAQKTYYLTYSDTTTATARYLLTEIQECAGTGTSNCLAPTNVAWQPGTSGIGSGTVLSGSAGSVYSTAYDFSGDGRNDLVMTSSTGAILVDFASSSGYATPTATGLSDTNGLALGDIGGSGVGGILTALSGTWYYYRWNGTSFVGTTTGITVATAPEAILADVDGDGRADFVYTDSTGIVHVRLSTSTPSTVSFSSDINTTIGQAGFNIRAQIGGSNRALHFWGGAQADLLGTVRTCAEYNAKNICVTYEYIYYALHFTGSTFLTAGLFPAPLSSPNPAVDFADYNDDGCTDILTTTQLLLSACNGNAPVTVAIPTGDSAVGGMDWNGDGRRDVLVTQSSGTLGVLLSTGTGVASTAVNTSYSTSGIAYTAAPNLTGDGQDGLIGSSGTTATVYLHSSPGAPPDLLTSVTDGYGNMANPIYTSIAQGNYSELSDAVYPYQNYIGPMYVVYETKFSDPSKVPNGIYSQQFSYGGAWVNLQGRGLQGFKYRSTVDSRTALYEYQYYERSFPYTGMMYEDVFSNSSVYPSISEGNPVMLTLDPTPNNERYFPYFNGVTTVTREVGGPENGDPSSTTDKTFIYDNYGNATTINTTVTDNDPNSPTTGQTWTTTTVNTTDISTNQSADLAAGCLSLIDETQVTYSSSLSGSASVTRTKTFTPDTPALCRIKTIITEPTANSGLYKVTEALTFDSFGNVATDTVTGATMPNSPASRVTTRNWGTTGQFLNTLTDPSGAVSTWSYTSNQALTFGVPDSLKNANNLTTSWTYDGFGRKTKETRPDGTSTGWAWSLCTSYCGWSNSVYQIAQTDYQTNGTTKIRIDTNSYDPIDRVTQATGPTVTGGSSTVQTLYNSLGLLYQQSMPFLSGGTVYQQTFAYDVLNRPISVTRPTSSTVSTPQSTIYGYAGRTTTVTDPKGYTKTTVTDVKGWLRQAKDAQTPTPYTVTRAYDSAGSLTGITDSVGNTLLKNVTVVYGIKPFVTAATDADRGAWTYSVDSLGERTAWTDAKGQSFSMTYDALSRPLSRVDPITATDPGLLTQWQYGSTPASDNVGQLIYECTIAGNPGSCGTSPLYSETRAYDSEGRLSTRSITESGNPGNDTGSAFLFTLGYSSTTGQLSSLTYPKSTSSYALNLQYAYGNGLLSSVTDTTDTTAICGTSCTLWTATAMNARGQMTEETLGNGVVMNRNYDAVTFWLTAATGGVGGGAALLNQSYTQDDNGNVNLRQNNNSPGLNESFGYDNDNRLNCTALASTCTTATIVYDGGSAGPGNITSMAGVGTYTYPTPGQVRPHAVSSITGTVNGIVNPTYSYDSNGNMTSRASTGVNITWAAYNYPTEISASDATGSEEVQFSYGPERQRWEQIYTGPSGTEKTYYVGGLIDIVFNGTTNYRQYIYAGSEPIAVYSRTSAGVNTLSYMLEDHQGGVSAITSSAGAADVNESFTAFGNRRNPTTWSGTPTTSDLNTIASLSRQGYTFQTALGQSMGLNHMNGRVQDDVIGRFLSPDPHVPDPTNAQSYNRYSYVDNNPLTFVDPTGFIRGYPSYGTDNGFFWGAQDVSFGEGLTLDNVANGIIDLGALTNLLNATVAALSNSVNQASGAAAATSSTTNQSAGSAQGTASQGAQPDPNAPQSAIPGDQLDSIVVTAQKLSFIPGYGLIVAGLPSFFGTNGLYSSQYGPTAFEALATQYHLGVSTNHLPVKPDMSLEDISDYNLVMIAVDGNGVVQGVGLFTGATGISIGSDASAVGMNFADYLVSKGLAPLGGPIVVQ